MLNLTMYFFLSTSVRSETCALWCFRDSFRFSNGSREFPLQRITETQVFGGSEGRHSWAVQIYSCSGGVVIYREVVVLSTIPIIRSLLQFIAFTIRKNLHRGKSKIGSWVSWFSPWWIPTSSWQPVKISAWEQILADISMTSGVLKKTSSLKEYNTIVSSKSQISTTWRFRSESHSTK